MAALHKASRQGLQLGSRLAEPLQARSLSSLALGSWWQPPSSAPAGGGSVAAAPAAWQQRVTGLLPSLCDILLAVPKKKVSPHRRGNRNATKFIRWVPVVAQCSKCQRVFGQHQVPSKCEHDDCPAYTLRRRPDSPSS